MGSLHVAVKARTATAIIFSRVTGDEEATAHLKFVTAYLECDMEV